MKRSCAVLRDESSVGRHESDVTVVMWRESSLLESDRLSLCAIRNSHFPSQHCSLVSFLSHGQRSSCDGLTCRAWLGVLPGADCVCRSLGYFACAEKGSPPDSSAAHSVVDSWRVVFRGGRGFLQCGSSTHVSWQRYFSRQQCSYRRWPGHMVHDEDDAVLSILDIFDDRCCWSMSYRFDRPESREVLVFPRIF
jgi:hypothetical protein